MKYSLVFFTVLIATLGFSQNHAEEVKKITTIGEARAYASRYREVSISTINAIQDKFVFEQLDTTDAKANIGKSYEDFGRVSRIVSDTTINIADIELIQFDLSKTSETSYEILMGQIKKRIDAGATYWEIKSKFSHTSAYFYSGPRTSGDIRFVNVSDLEDKLGEWVYFEHEELRGLVRLKELKQNIQAYFILGYNAQ